MKSLYFLILASFSTVAEVNLQLQSQLSEMAAVDQEIRRVLGQSGRHQAPEELRAQVSKIDEVNTSKLKKMLEGRSWFTAPEVGTEGIRSAFLIIQHSPDLEFQVKMLPKLRQSYLNGEGITGQQLALITDRVLLAKDNKQIYGTQARFDEGIIVIEPIENPATVNERRAEMGMPPLEDYFKLLEEMYGIKDHPEIKMNVY
ncbi:DUF6624 domain-containing protein [Photobacterium sp. 1_MG-2023]|uniref:DUF6624 domain-containing protein n=1 Tax=Photobacterium sp. 1_MG-2023 TaxID=3062646 RepID=UPI0026E156AF|nr:DUF6624 domain-containing protein [Photobacterium sp. 1_MG-2023]MDO6705532.1 hypothetical protein [Photobacterium sp. 1_MG-2023]